MNKPELMTDETLEAIWNSDTTDPSDHGSFYYVKVLAKSIIAARDAQWEQMLAAQEPVAWLLPEKTVNHLVVESIERLIKLCKGAHMADIKVRANGKDYWFEADWVKYLQLAAPQPAQEPTKTHTALLAQALEALQELRQEYVSTVDGEWGEGVGAAWLPKTSDPVIAAIKEALK